MKMYNNLFIYTDESGNSGSNFFDSQQPIFYTSTIISKLDLESEDFLEFHNTLLELVEDNEIHMNQLSNEKRLKLVEYLVPFIVENNIEIFFTELEKVHMLKMAFVDYIFDSGLNPKMNNVTYNRRFERLPFALGFAIHLTNEHMMDFFRIIFTEPVATKNELFSKLLSEIKDLMSSVERDEELQVMITDSLQYAIENPNIFIENNASNIKYILPNVHSILYIMNYLNSFDSIGQIKKFWFDESKILKGTGWMRERGMEFHISIEPFSIISDISKKNNIDKSKYKHLNSKDSFGLQIADVFVWLFSRYRSNTLDKNLEALLEPILLNEKISRFSAFTYNQLVNDVRQHIKILEEGF